MNGDDQFLNQIRTLNVHHRGDRRAPHKPLLLLIAIADLLQGKREVPFEEAERKLKPLLNAYAPPVQARHQPELPYWYLRSDHLWEIDGAESFPLQQGGFPRMAALRTSSGHLPVSFANALLSKASLVDEVVQSLLVAHFPESLHEDILAAVGLKAPVESMVAEDQTAYGVKRGRDPRFREAVLRAYEHRCAVTGFRAALGGSYFGCEAAHVQWHAYAGPDTVANGLAMEPTLHKLFDAGAWTLSDDRRILVSAEFTGTDEAVARLRSHHGRPLLSPQAGEPLVSTKYIRWHREKEYGGVFRPPALSL